MSDSGVLLERASDPRIARLILNRPARRNAFDGELVALLQRAMRELASDATTRVVELSGAGKTFCAGADIDWMKKVSGFTMQENLRDSAELASLFRSFDELPKPIVARVQGAALGGGTGLVAVCDVVVAAENAIFGTTEVRIGVIPAVISPYLVHKVGESRARAWFVTGERVSAEEALQAGLVHRVVPERELGTATRMILDAILLGGPEAVAEAKHLVQAVATMSLRDATNVAIQRLGERRASAEGREGLAAFLEKRRPSWATEPAAKKP
ncbi:MAG TPA: enoyl-CoA hydratase-related protein [Thermoanaerobaculia bacterium]|nr:enoyl-CoA hydratase-related protein [Thermoanaerobaculia bacterium]